MGCRILKLIFAFGNLICPHLSIIPGCVPVTISLPRQRNLFAVGRDVASHSAFECLEPFPWRLHTHSSNLSCATFIQHRASILRPALLAALSRLRSWRDYGGQVAPCLPAPVPTEGGAGRRDS
jgi:hypothetical protein